MSAIITNQFRRNSRKLFLESVSDTDPTSNYFIGIGKSDPWPDIGTDTEDSLNYSVPLPNNSVQESSDALQNLIGLIEVAEEFAVIPRNEYVLNRKYKVYDPTDPDTFNIDSVNELYPSYVISGDRVYVCLANNNGEKSTDNPTYNVAATPNVLNDGYAWALVCTIDNTSSFYTDQFVDIPNTSLASAEVATGGIVYGFKIIDGGSNLALADNFELIGTDEAGNQFANVDITSNFDITLVDGAITSIIPKTGTNTWQQVKHASVKVTQGAVEQSVDIIPLVAPVEGFGSSPHDDLPTFYAGLYAQYTGNVSGEIPVGLSFRQISVVKDPTTTADLTTGVIDTLRYMTLDNTSGLSSLAKGTIIEGSNGAKAYLDYVDGDNVYYHQNSNSEINQKAFVDGDINVAIDTVGDLSITALSEGEYEQDSGELIFLENRKAISRNINQQEDIKIVIQF